MTTIYLINNSLTINNLNFPNKDSLENKREKRILSIQGEKEAADLALNSAFETVNAIYASPYVMSIGTAKYLAQRLEIDIIISELIGEQVLGNLGDKKIRMVREAQENNFDYKLSGGESLNDVKKRMLKFMDMILNKYEGKTIAVFTHNVAITSFLSNYCDKGFNLDNRLILNYQEEAIVDGTWDGISVIELNYQNKKITNIKRRK